MAEVHPETALVLDKDVLKQQIEAAIASAAFKVEPDWRPGIDAHFEAIARAAALVMDFRIDDELDPAPVFAA
jgi:Protein of unknown function (DUF4089)